MGMTRVIRASIPAVSLRIAPPLPAASQPSKRIVLEIPVFIGFIRQIIYFRL